MRPSAWTYVKMQSQTPIYNRCLGGHLFLSWEQSLYRLGIQCSMIQNRRVPLVLCRRHLNYRCRG